MTFFRFVVLRAWPALVAAELVGQVNVELGLLFDRCAAPLTSR